MTKFKILVLAAVTACSLVSASAASAAGYYHRYWGNQASATAAPPLGFQIFCLQNPEQCRASGKSSIDAGTSTMHLIAMVNASVNRSIKPRNDVGADTWTANPSSGYGDCEDYAMTKRAKLIGMGLPASALRLAYVKTSWGEGHAVLVVRTNGQELVLDNLTAAILPFHATGLRLVSISGADPMSWTRG